MKKSKNVLLLSLLALVGTCVGCGSSSGNSEIEVVDTNKVQIYVYNFNGGYGSQWLSNVKKRFEAKYENTTFDGGKRGVQIMITNQKDSVMSKSGNILDNKEDVYFTEFAYYYTLLAEGVLGDITDVVTETLSEYGETQSIEDKLTAEQKAYWGVTDESGATKYYGLPHYSGYAGLTYNVDLFDEKLYYFTDQPVGTNDEDYFVASKTEKRSKGPDGEYDTDDDGLPSTYDEFFRLCRYIYTDGNVPIVCNGKNSKDYVDNLTQSLITDYEGLEQMSLNYSYNGVATDLGKIVNNEFVKDENPTTIDPTQNGYELGRQAGKYYASKFIETIVNNKNYRNANLTNSSYSHLDAQDDFLYGGNDGVTQSIGMICDGIWWENEADATFKEMADSKGSSFSRENRRFAFMPLPKATEEKYNENLTNGKDAKKATLFDHIFSICFMKANVEESKKPIVKDFIRFVHTNESLVEYTITTDTPKAFTYTLTDEEKSKLSYYGRSVINLKERSNIVYPVSQSAVYKNNQSFFATHQQLYTRVNGVDTQYILAALVDKGYTAEQYYSGMYEYQKNHWSILNL